MQSTDEVFENVLNWQLYPTPIFVTTILNTPRCQPFIKITIALSIIFFFFFVNHRIKLNYDNNKYCNTKPIRKLTQTPPARSSSSSSRAFPNSPAPELHAYRTRLEVGFRSLSSQLLSLPTQLPPHSQKWNIQSHASGRMDFSYYSIRPSSVGTYCWKLWMDSSKPLPFWMTVVYCVP